MNNKLYWFLLSKNIYSQFRVPFFHASLRGGDGEREGETPRLLLFPSSPACLLISTFLFTILLMGYEREPLRRSWTASKCANLYKTQRKAKLVALRPLLVLDLLLWWWKFSVTTITLITTHTVTITRRSFTVSASCFTQNNSVILITFLIVRCRFVIL